MQDLQYQKTNHHNLFWIFLSAFFFFTFSMWTKQSEKLDAAQQSKSISKCACRRLFPHTLAFVLPRRVSVNRREVSEWAHGTCRRILVGVLNKPRGGGALWVATKQSHRRASTHRYAHEVHSHPPGAVLTDGDEASLRWLGRLPWLPLC